MLYAAKEQAMKAELATTTQQGFAELVESVDRGACQRELEEQVWQVVLSYGRLLMGAALSRQCARATERDIEARGLDPKQVTLRQDRDYHGTLETTLGSVTFPWFAYRDHSVVVGTVTRTPAREAVLPLFKSCRSSELLLQWESRLGSDHPFRYAQEALSFFTHGAASREDTTIARHMVTVGNLVDREWTYRTPESIAELLWTRATRDPNTGRPLLYASTDAHALRTYVDETWDAQWKMANGIRLWCVDGHNGATIHLGGEYTWGNCEKVQEAFEWLRDTKRLPADGRMVNRMNVQVVLVTDGAPWIKERLTPLFPRAVVLLDAYHFLEALAKYAIARFVAGTAAMKEFYQRALDALFGKSRGNKPKAPKRRRGHAKRTSPALEESPMPPDNAPHARRAKRAPAADRLLELLAEKNVPDHLEEEHAKLVNSINHNANRIDYERWRVRGYQIGSGAMESLHRTASQTRLKVAGIRCLPETSQAIFNLRMLRLCGRWDEFWHQDAISSVLVEAFAATKAKPLPPEVTSHPDAEHPFQQAS